VRVGRYTVLEQLGAGAMGAVYLASDPELGRRVAIKLLSSRGGDDHRLLDEARALAKLQHPNVVAIHDVGRWDGRVYIAMEHVAGRSLDGWLDQHTGWRDRLDAFRQAALGLAAAHRAGIVHHDVKPSNIMAGDDGRVRLVDFGLARSSTPEGGSGSGGGTPRYMSPEQRRGLPADARTDQFSLCVAMYEALFTGHPFEGDTAEQRHESVLAGRLRTPAANEVPAAMRDAILKGLACDPAERHASMDELLAAIAPPPPPRRTWLVGATIAFAAIAGVGAAFGMRSHPAAALPAKPAGKYDAILAASHLPPELKQPLPGDVIGVTVHHLSNGLTVYISPNHDTPRLHASIRIRAGQGDGPGVAMLAMGATQRGSEKIGTTDWAKEKPLLDQIRADYVKREATRDPAQRTAIDADIAKLSTQASQYEILGDHDRVIQDFGMHFNGAATQRDATVFLVDIPSNRLDAWAELEADRFAHPVLRQFRMLVAETAHYTEEEDNDPYSKLQDIALPILFGHKGIGFDYAKSRQVIETEPYLATEKFLHDYYAPNNADLVLSGDVDPVTALPILERAFAQWEPRAVPERTIPDLQPVAPRTIDVPTTGWRGVAYHWALPRVAEDDPALLTVKFMLSRDLQLANNREEMVAPYIGGFQISVASLAGESLDDTQHVLDRVLARIVDGTFTDAELESANRDMRIFNATQDRENGTRDLAIRNIRVPLHPPTWAAEVARREAESKITRADIARLSTELFKTPHLTFRADKGAVERPPLASFTLPETHFPNARSKAGLALVNRDVVQVQPKYLMAGADYNERDTDGGHLIVKQDVKSTRFELEVRWPVGTDALPLICANMLSRATDLTPRWYQDAFLSVEPACESRFVVLRLMGMDEQLPEALDYLYARFDEPSPASWENNRKDLERALASATATSGWIQNVAQEVALFGGQSLSKVDRSALVGKTPADGARAGEQLRHVPRWVGYTGPRSLDEVEKVLPRLVRSGKVPQQKQKVLLREPRVILVDAHALSDTANVSLLYGVDHVNDPAQQLRLNLLTAYWSGDLHPLNDALRGNSLFSADVVGSQDPRDPGAIAFRLKTTPKDAPQAIADTLHAVFEAPHDAAILTRAKAARDEGQRNDWIGYDEVVNRLIQWRMLGESGDPRIAFHEQWAKVGMPELDAVTAELRHAPHTIVIWGNLAGLDRAALAEYGKLEDLTPAQLLDAHHLFGSDARKPARGGPGGHVVAKRKR
jgi:predicted Zn-dependent peptidase